MSESQEGIKLDEKRLLQIDLWDENYNERMAQAGERSGAPQNVIDYYRKPEPPIVEVVAKFLSFIEYLDWDELEEEFKKRVRFAPRGLISDLKALEELISTPQEKDVLAYLVAVDANRNIPDPSDDGAREWIREIAEMVRKALGDLAPPQAA